MHSRHLAMVGSVAVGFITMLLFSSLMGSLRESAAADLLSSLQAAEKPVDTYPSDSTPIHYVATTGSDIGDCSKPISACLTVQYAVDQAGEGDEVHVAGGVYTGVSVRPRNDITSTGVVTQMVYVSKTVIIRGGYTVTNDFAGPPNPKANPTTLDAQGRGRVFYITGNVSQTIEGLRITGGDATGLQGASWEGDTGGGLYLITATAIIRDNQVISNTARDGGGLFLAYSDAIVYGNTIVSNTVGHAGGGLFFWDGRGTLTENAVAYNDASRGGGIALYEDSNTMLNGNVVIYNRARRGGGLVLGTSSNARLVNNVIADNQASIAGSGILVSNSTARLLHNTIARNSEGDGVGIYMWRLEPNYSTVTMTNNIIVSHALGITATEGTSATLDATLWGNGTNLGGPGAISHTHDYTGTPAFVDPDAGDYHISADSAAIDKGVEAGINADIDSEPRLGYPDLGADEYVRHFCLPLLFKEFQ